MSDLKKLFVGQQIKKFPAHTWNKLLAGELRDRGRRNPPDIQTGSPHSPVIVRLRWEGASAIGPGAAVKLTNSIFIPGTDEFGGSYGLGFACVAFGVGDPLENYAITIGPIDSGGENIGYGVIPEAWWAQVNITNEDHDYATAISGTQLVSSTSGLPILWKPTGTGVKWVVVQIHTQTQIVRGTTTAAVLSNAPTFQIDNLVAISGKAPPEPLTIQQVFPVGYANGQDILVIAAANGDWINTPDPGKVRVNADDKVPDYIYEKIVDKSTFSASLHQVVYAQAVIAGDARNLKLFTNQGSGGGGTYTAGCGIDIASNVVSVDPVDLAGDGLIPDVATTCGLAVNVDNCTLKIESDVVKVDLDNIAGCGLEKDTGSEPPYDYCKLAIKTDPNGCLQCLNETGLKVNVAADGCLECDSGLKVKVDPAGCIECGEGGLAVQIDPASTLLQCGANGLIVIIGIGCGLGFTTDTIFFDAPAVAGSGLIVEGVCSLAVNVGCGLEIAADQVRVKNSDLAGAGLGTDGTCGLKVNVGCGLEIVSDAVQVKVDSGSCLECDATYGLKLKGSPVTIRSIKECELVIEGGELKLKLTYDEYEVCAEAGLTDQIEECSVAVINCNDV